MDEATQEKQKLVTSIVKSIAYAENGGKPNIEHPSAGQSGEMKSIFQFEPGTWRADAKKILGSADAPLTPDNETYVMMHKVATWINEGKTVEEMASIHNSGNPNAYKENHVGVNKYGVRYDTPAYAKKVANYAKKFYLGANTNIDSSGTALSTESTPDTSGPLGVILKTIGDAQKNSQSQPIQNNALNPTVSPQSISTQNKGLLETPVSKNELSSKMGGLFNGNVTATMSRKAKPSKDKPLKKLGLIS